MLVTSRARSRLPLTTAVAQAVAGGVSLVQVREPEMQPTERLRMLSQLRALTAGRALLLVNRDVTSACAIGADGIHLPECGVSLGRVRQSARLPLLLGRSVHSVEAARRAEAEGADYLLVGSIFATASHPGQAPAGLGLLAEVRAAVRVPLLAIGGITPQNAGGVMRAGATGAAVIGTILESGEPGRVAADLRRAMQTG